MAPACDWQIVSGPFGRRADAIDNNNNPRWNECRTLTTNRRNADLRLEVVDYDYLSNDSLGSIYYPLTDTNGNERRRLTMYGTSSPSPSLSLYLYIYIVGFGVPSLYIYTPAS